MTAFERELASSKAAAQAAAEASAQDVAALSTVLMRSEARCQELQAARSEVWLQLWTAVWLAHARHRGIRPIRIATYKHLHALQLMK